MRSLLSKIFFSLVFCVSYSYNAYAQDVGMMELLQKDMKDLRETVVALQAAVESQNGFALQHPMAF
jgi:hypothetical protein